MRSKLMSIESSQKVSAPVKKNLARWHRLQEERRFRVEQLAALDQELAASGRHECVKLALRIAASSALAEVDAALVRLAEERYGACVTCAQQIPAERLDVLPMTPLCMSCHYNAQNCRLATTSRGERSQ